VHKTQLVAIAPSSNVSQFISGKDKANPNMSYQLEYAIRHLPDSDQRLRQESLETITADPDKSLELLMEILRSNPSIRWRALCALKCLDVNLTAALPLVIAHLHDVNRLCRMAAAELIARMGTEAKAAVPDLVELLDDKDEAVRKLALSGLSRIGLGSSDVKSVDPLGRILKRHIRNRDQTSRESVREAVDLLKSIGSSAVPTLISCLRKAIRPNMKQGDYEDWLFEPVLKALEQLLPVSKRAGVKLIKLLKLAHAPARFRKDVLWLLSFVGQDDVDRVVNAFIDFRRDDEYGELYPDLFAAFCKLGLPAIPILIQIVNEHNETRSSFAAYVLGSFNDPEYPVYVDNILQQAVLKSVPALIAAFVAGGTELQLACAYALGTMESKAGVAEPVLTDALQHRSRHVREAAGRALKLISKN
jgi:hypothetical protein